MKTMAVGRIIVLSALFAQALSAPSGCIESCNFYHSSHQSRQTSGGYQDHAGLIQGSTNLNEHDYTKPGNWTEHNQYDTDSGHGKVHEERGQYVEGSNRVRYYKKNFTSSYSTGNVDGAGTDGRVELDQLTGHQRHESTNVPNYQHLDSQNTYDQAGATSVTKESGYSRVHNQQTHSSSRRTDNQSERLEDFGEYGGHSQVNQRVSGGSSSSQTSDTSYHTDTIPQNWSRVDSYGTDGGRGQVFEEEGQYVTGPKKVRYYKKNYSSSYSTSGVPQVNAGSTTLQDLHHELQQNLHKQLDNVRREFHQTSNIDHVASSAHTNSAQSLTQETVSFHNDDLQTAESDTYRQQLTHHHIPSTGNIHHYANQQQRETFADTRQHIPYTYPSATAGTYGQESQRTYQSHETYVSQVHPTSQPTHLSHLSPVSPGYLQRPIIRNDYQSNLHNVHSIGHHAVDDTQRAIASSTHQSSIAQNQLFADNSQRVYHPNPDQGTYPARRGQTTHYEEHWSSSSGTGGNLYPDRSMPYDHTNRAHYDRDAYNEHLNRHRTAQGYDSHTHTSGNTYNSAYRTNSGQLVTGSLDLGHVAQGAVDCNEEIQQHQQESRYHRKYKRDDHHGFVDEHQRQTAEHDDLKQQYQEFGQESQQLEGLTQQSEQFTQQTEGSDDLTQQTSGKLEFGQQTVGNQHLEDLTQQTEGSDDFTQQTSGKLEFGQQTVGNQHLEDLTQQTEGSDDFTQRTSGKLEFGQQTAGNQHLEDLTQQSEQFTQQTEGSDDFTQQTSGKLEFGQQTAGNQHLEDLTQQSEQFTQQTEGSDDFTQQTSGKLEFGQQTMSNQHPEDLTQQNEQFTQQTEGSDNFVQVTNGKLEFGQQVAGNQHLEDLTQQSEQFTQHTEGSDDFTQQTSGKLELGQQTVSNEHLKDLTQQTDGQLEFGQHTVGNLHLEDLTQQSKQFEQQTAGSDDFTQQSVGELNYGQQIDDSQQLEHLTQQIEQLSQRTERSDDVTQQNSKLEFGQQTVGNQHLEDLTQQIEQFEQQTGSDDFTQQTSSKLELEQQTVGYQHLEDLTQQTQQFEQQTTGSHDFTQQKSGKLEFGHTVDNEHLKDLTQQSEQITQQMSDKLEFGQHVQPINKVSKPKNQHLEEFNHQKEDFVQQTEGSDEFTQQTMGHLEFAQQMQQTQRSGNRHLEDFTQQDKDLTQQVGGFDDFMQQTSQYLGHGQQREQQWKPVRPKYDDQYSKDSSQQSRPNQEFEWQLRQTLQNTDFNQDFTQQTDHNQQITVRPISKPKPKQRYQKQDLNPSHIGTNIDDVSKPIEINSEADMVDRNEDRRTVQYGSGGTYPTFNYHNSRIENQQSQGSNGFDNEKENIDRLHWVHKSNDATVGLQWHYTYHPSDLTNVESSHNIYYPRYNSMSQQTEQQQKPFDFSRQEIQDKDTFDFSQQETQSTHTSETSPLHNQFNQKSENIPVIPLQRTRVSQQTAQLDKQSSQASEQAEPKMESRILEAYGGPYDALRNDDIYRRVKPNPSATLPPIYDKEAWDIREKPREREMISWSIETTFSPINKLDIDKVDDVSTTEMVETTTQIIETTTKEEAASSFWTRVGHKITSTYDKAKEKAKEIFG